MKQKAFMYDSKILHLFQADEYFFFCLIPPEDCAVEHLPTSACDLSFDIDIDMCP